MVVVVVAAAIRALLKELMFAVELRSAEVKMISHVRMLLGFGPWFVAKAKTTKITLSSTGVVCWEMSTAGDTIQLCEHSLEHTGPLRMSWPSGEPGWIGFTV